MVDIEHDLFAQLPPAHEMTFVNFKEIWRQRHLGRVLLIALDDEDPEQFQQEVFKTFTDKLGSSRDTATRLAAVYSLYICYLSQVFDRKYKITMPEYMWAMLLEYSKEFNHLPFPDGHVILHKMLKDGMFAFTLDQPYVAPEAMERKKQVTVESRPITESELAPTLSQLSDLENVVHPDKFETIQSAYSQAYSSVFGAGASGDDNERTRMLRRLRHELNAHEMNVQHLESLSPNAAMVGMSLGMMAQGPGRGRASQSEAGTSMQIGSGTFLVVPPSSIALPHSHADT